MTKLIFALLFITQPFSPDAEKVALTSSTIVYVCDSQSSKKYHYKKNCRGLNACSHEIKSTTLTNARSMKLTLCGWED